MSDDLRPEGEMIEIGDLTEESVPALIEPPTRVVIEYRDRGVPWMLLPPLLILSGVVAVVSVPKLRKDHDSIAARVPASPEVKAPPIRPVPVPEVVATPAVPVSNPSSTIPPEPSAPAQAPASDPVEVPQAEPMPAPPPFPRIQGLGFDPGALANASRPEATIDPSITAAGENRGAPAPEIEALPKLPGEGDRQAIEVDPEVLPPDPRLSRQARLQRSAEARRKAEADRGKFHSELAEILRRQGDRGAGSILQLCQEYGTDVDPEAKRRVMKFLGESGIYAGASRPVRINLMRAEGFPESAILGDIFDNDTRHLVDKKGTERVLSKAVRGGPRSIDEAYCSAARTLLSYSPRRTARAAPSSPDPAASPNARSFDTSAPPR